jgi:hypothetical protein
MPTKHKRHAITETAPVKEALDALRAELNGERLDLGEVVVLGAEEKLARLRAPRVDDQAKLDRLAERILDGDLHLDPVLADEAKRSWVRGDGPAPA